MTGWHADTALLDAYAAGALGALEAASVEQHLDHCATCRGLARPMVDDLVLERMWDHVRDGAERPTLPAVVRLARRCGLPEPTAILLASTAALRTAWLTSSLVAVGFALLASRFAGADALWPFLLVAPLVPVLGVATAYGPAHDPGEALAVTAPYGRSRLIWVRTLAVLVSCLPATTVLGLLLPGPDWVAVAWLGPALMIVPVMLALAGFVGPRYAAAALAIAWSGLVVGAQRTYSATWPVEAEQQLVFLVLAVVATFVLVLRSRSTRGIGVAL